MADRSWTRTTRTTRRTRKGRTRTRRTRQEAAGGRRKAEGKGGRQGRKARAEGRRRKATDIKSNNPHLAGGEKHIFHWIGLRENLQESPIFNGKIYGFL